MPKMFGTDGVRGVAGQPPLDDLTVRRLGAALIRALRVPEPARVVVGRDTRESGPAIERALAVGVRALGGDLQSAGVIPTPALAELTRDEGFHAGVVISASHNPFEDNGIKVFSARGEKLDEALEAEIEALVADPSFVVPEGQDREVAGIDGVARYATHARRVVNGSLGPLAGVRIGMDCAHGATTTVAPDLFRALGLDVVLIGAAPDGRNINLQCGSTHIDAVRTLVRDEGLAAGVAFDGDGDRCLLVDDQGLVVDGDAILLILALHLQAAGGLTHDTVVATVMSNIGLEIALRQRGIRLLRTAVGDKYVMEEMARGGFALGGEQSGHVILARHLCTGDGIVTALSVLQVMAETGRSLHELASALTTYPQVLVNLRVGRKVPVDEVPALAAVMGDVVRRLGDSGRLLVRYSGTEPLLRVMIEGQDQAEIQTWAQEIAETARVALAET
jgi:phosphoglucosamine mutase